MTFGDHAIAHGDVLACLRELPDNDFDGALFDPPYGLRFMGKRWDYDVPSVEVFAELRRVLKPGAPCVFFGGTRTFHRMACNAEDGGIELADCLAWMYGSGFPKSLDISKALDKAAGVAPIGRVPASGHGAMRPDGDWNVTKNRLLMPPATTPLAQQWAGYGTALKPAWEPAILGFKPNEGTYANNVARWGVGGLAIDACRIGTGEDKTPAPTARGDSAPWFTSKDASNLGGDDSKGRWPANVVLDEEAGALLDAQTGTLTSGKSAGFIGDVTQGNALGRKRKQINPATIYADSGGASRFFYSAKVSKREREYGCEALALRSAGEVTGREDGSTGLSNPRAGAGRGSGARNHHPTLKPIALTQWLARLILPPTPGATLLVPYSGAGSEMIGALRAGWPAVFGIEQSAEYIEIAHARIAAWAKGEP